MLQIKLESALAQLKKLKAKRVLLQIPEGLKTQVEEIVAQLEGKGFEVVTSMDACFGACDIKQGEAKRLGCDTILHLGHSKFASKTKVPVVYAPLEQEIGNFSVLAKKAADLLTAQKVKSVGLTTTIQFVHYLPELKKILKKEGIAGEIGKGERTENGQVLGCNYSSAQVKTQAILFLGDGLFHPLGIHFSTGKKVFLANPIEGEVKVLEKEREDFLRKRIMLIERAKEAKSYAILVSTKEGQNRISDAEQIKKILEKAGKRTAIYSMDFISQEALLGINAESFINTACPRISIDDYAQYKKPIINKNEIDFLLGKKNYDKYKLEAVY